MSQPWIKLWKADLLSSANYQQLTVYHKGIYNILLTICRDDDYPGQFCWPNGLAMTVDEIITAMGPKRGDRRDRITAALTELEHKGMLIRVGGVLTIRKYKEKTTIGQDTADIKTTPSQRGDNIGTSSSTALHTESDKESDTDKDKDIIGQDPVLAHLIKAQVANCQSDKPDKIRAEFSDAIKAGIPASKIEVAISKNIGRKCWDIVNAIRKDGQYGKTTRPGKTSQSEDRRRQLNNLGQVVNSDE